MSEYKQTIENGKILSEAKIEQLSLLSEKLKYALDKALSEGAEITEKTETQNSAPN